MARRLLDLVLASLGLLVTGPLLALAAVAIRLASPGPVLYRAARAGRGGRPFIMYKLRTMHAGVAGAAITGRHDPRVFPLGAWLRRTKIDELPQLLNVLRGDMTIVGPRPEDPRIVAAHYTPIHLETLAVRPGLASPGSLYHYTHGDRMLTGHDPERAYIERLLPFKLALDVVYVRRASLWYDIAIMGRTLRTITGLVLGRKQFPDPPEARAAAALLTPQERSCTPAPSSSPRWPSSSPVVTTAHPAHSPHSRRT